MSRPLNKDAKTSKFTIEVAMELRERIDACAKREDRLMSTVIRRAIEDYLDKSEAAGE